MSEILIFKLLQMTFFSVIIVFDFKLISYTCYSKNRQTYHDTIL